MFLKGKVLKFMLREYKQTKFFSHLKYFVCLDARNSVLLVFLFSRCFSAFIKGKYEYVHLWQIDNVPEGLKESYRSH